jgi:hypothetical protein
LLKQAFEAACVRLTDDGRIVAPKKKAKGRKWMRLPEGSLELLCLMGAFLGLER